jgi:hypothetical protein
VSFEQGKIENNAAKIQWEKDPIDGKKKQRFCRKSGKNRRICYKRVRRQKTRAMIMKELKKAAAAAEAIVKAKAKR